MQTYKKALIALLCANIFAQTAQATMQPTIRSVALTAVGGAIAYKCLETTKKIIDMILEEDPTLDDATLLKKVTILLRYGFGLTTAVAGTYCAVAIIANANNENFLIPGGMTTTNAIEN
jgi:hypothetical protein